MTPALHLWKRTRRSLPAMCHESWLEPDVQKGEFCDLAQQVTHRFDGQPALPDAMGSPWEEQQPSPRGWRVRPEHGVAQRLTSELPRATSTPRCWSTLMGKRLLLFKYMLQSINHSDVRVTMPQWASTLLVTCHHQASSRPEPRTRAFQGMAVAMSGRRHMRPGGKLQD